MGTMHHPRCNALSRPIALFYFVLCCVGRDDHGSWRVEIEEQRYLRVYIKTEVRNLSIFLLFTKLSKLGATTVASSITRAMLCLCGCSRRRRSHENKRHNARDETIHLFYCIAITTIGKEHYGAQQVLQALQ
jgi:hypothetical protein